MIFDERELLVETLKKLDELTHDELVAACHWLETDGAILAFDGNGNLFTLEPASDDPLVIE